MAGARQPTALVELKGKKHFTKAELEERKNAEVNADADNIVPPDYLTEKQAGEFLALADELKRCEIMTNLDCDALARFVVARFVDEPLALNRYFMRTISVLVTFHCWHAESLAFG